MEAHSSVHSKATRLGSAADMTEFIVQVNKTKDWLVEADTEEEAYNKVHNEDKGLVVNIIESTTHIWEVSPERKWPNY